MIHEGHITVCDRPAPRKIEVFREYAKSLGLKPLFITLDRGDNIDQLMAGIKFVGLDPVSAAVRLGQLAGKLENAGFPTQRIKLECSLNNEILDWKYFECHYKVYPQAWAPESPSKEREIMDGFLDIHHAGLSFNQFDTSMFLTQRCYAAERFAVGQFEAFDIGVRKYFKVIKAHSKCVLVDTNPDLDKGWMV